MSPGWVRVAAGSILLLLCSVVAAAPAAAQETATLFGRALDEGGGPVRDVAVSVGAVDASGGRTVLTDAGGNFRFVGVLPGRYRVRASRLGLQPVEREVVLAPGESRRLDLVLTVDTVRLEGVVVEGRRAVDREREVFESEPGITARVVGGEQLGLLPGLAEADVLRAIELLPGVVSTSDFSSAFHVRGGSADQNLILLDGFPVFNPFHLGGLFGVFNADAIQSAELLAGGFGAQYGGRVSSVLNVMSATEPRGTGLEVLGGVSLLATRVMLRSDFPDAIGQSLGGEGGSWLVSARRSYFDQLLRPFFSFPYHLTDIQANAGIQTRGGGRVSFTGYTGADVLDLSEFEAPGSDDGAESVLRVKWDWGNRVAGVRWDQPFGERWRADSRIGFSGFREQLGFVDFGDVEISSRIEQITLATDLVRSFERAEIRTGGSLERLRFDNLGEAGGTRFFASAGDGTLTGAYGSVRATPTRDWNLEVGLRLDGWASSDADFLLLSPRFAAKRFFGPDRDMAVKAAVGRYTQFLHSLRDEEFPISNDVWIVAGQDVPAVVSDQAQVGVERFFGPWSVSLEGYYRRFEGVTELNVADDPNDPSDDLLAGTGTSFGLDFLLRRTSGRLTGWTALSLLRARRTLPDPAALGWDDLPPTVTFAPIFDRGLDFDLVFQYLLPREVELGARWNFGSPLPYTRPVSQYVTWRHDIPQGRFEPLAQRDDGTVPLSVVLGPRNAERYPAYHRLDVTARRTFRPSWGTYTPYLQVLNVYNQRNVLFYFYNYDRVPATRSGISMFPVLPTLGVEMTFR